MKFRYSPEEAFNEAEKIKEIVGESGTKADYETAEKLVEEEVKKERIERESKKVLEIFDTYRSIINSLDEKEIDEIELNHRGRDGYSFLVYMDEKADEGILFRGTSADKFGTIENGFVDELDEKEPGTWSSDDGDDNVSDILEPLQKLDQIILSKKGQREAIINILEPVLDNFVRDYSDILQNIESVRTRSIGPERQIKLLENLEYRRKNLHNTMAIQLQEKLKTEGYKIGKENTRHLLALVFEMRRNLLESGEFEISDLFEYDELDTQLFEDKVVKIQKAIKEKFNFDSVYDEYFLGGGMHEFEDDYGNPAILDHIKRNTIRKIKVKFTENSLVTRKEVKDYIASLFGKNTDQ